MMPRPPKKVPPRHPGEILREGFLRPQRITPQDFARRLGVTRLLLSQILDGKFPITLDTALPLARVTGQPVDYWMGLQRDWDQKDADVGGWMPDLAG
jgi:addiction module HigA family antidote